MRDGRAAAEKPSAISISCVRTVLVQAVCSVRTLPPFFDLLGFCVFGVNVRPYQTACARTAGHWILEIAEGFSAAALVFGGGSWGLRSVFGWWELGLAECFWGAGGGSCGGVVAGAGVSPRGGLGGRGVRW